jgi:uncharacterized protein
VSAARKQVVHDLLAAYARSDAEVVRSSVTDDVLWWVPQSAAGRYPRPIRGVDAVVAVLAGPSRAYRKPTIAWTVRHVVSDESDIVMAAATMSAILVNGNEYANDYCYVFRFDGDRIAEATEYTDTAYAAERARAPVADGSGPRLLDPPTA